MNLIKKIFCKRRLGVEKELEDIIHGYIVENDKLKQELREVCVNNETLYAQKIIAEQKFLNQIEYNLWAGQFPTMEEPQK
jgi:hypothetical protein